MTLRAHPRAHRTRPVDQGSAQRRRRTTREASSAGRSAGGRRRPAADRCPGAGRSAHRRTESETAADARAAAQRAATRSTPCSRASNARCAPTSALSPRSPAPCPAASLPTSRPMTTAARATAQRREVGNQVRALYMSGGSDGAGRQRADRPDSDRRAAPGGLRTTSRRDNERPGRRLRGIGRGRCGPGGRARGSRRQRGGHRRRRDTPL